MEIYSQGWKFQKVYDGEEILKNIEEIGRVCYKSEDKITKGSAKKFIKKIIDSGHHSVIEHENVTVRVITDRGITHEIVRHRIASYSQESTRYCNYKSGVKFIKPVDFDLNADDLEFLKGVEKHYIQKLEEGASPQQARYFLPNGLKTEIVISFNLREWRHFFKLRGSLAAHPQLRVLTRDMLEEFKMNFPVIFDDIIFKK